MALYSFIVGGGGEGEVVQGLWSESNLLLTELLLYVDRGPPSHIRELSERASTAHRVYTYQ